MRRLTLLVVITFLVLPIIAFLPGNVFADEVMIFDAKVLEAQPITEQDGLRMQTISCEILEGDYKGTVGEVQVFLEKEFSRPLQSGDRIKVNLTTLNGDLYIQFYDFTRSSSYLWLFGLFAVAFIAFIGMKGIRIILPSVFVILLVILGIVPDFLPQGALLFVSLLLLSFITGLSAWVRLRNVPLMIISIFAVAISLSIAFLVFAGFSQNAYVSPFLGTITTVDDQILLDMLEVQLASILFVPAGAVIHSSIRIAEYISKRFRKSQKIVVGPMLKRGIKIGQKLAAIECNSIFLAVFGISLSGIYILKMQQPYLHFWDNGWVALQIIYIISAGISILLVAPITVLTAAGVLIVLRQTGERNTSKMFRKK